MKKNVNLQILILILLLGGLFVLAPRFGLLPGTVLSVSKVEIQPEGYVDENNMVRGSFWITTMLTDCTDDVAGWKFSNATDRAKFYQGEEVSLASEIEIIIDPEQPYWIRPLEVQTKLVYPETHGTWLSKIINSQYGKITASTVPKLTVNTYQFGARADVPNEWAVHTPFWITLKKNGVELAKQYVDTVGMVETIKLQNPLDPTEYITLKNLGKIGTGYGQPSITDIICIENQINYIFEGSDAVLNIIDYKNGDCDDMAYANYWFGGGGHYLSGSKVVVKWGDDHSPAHYTKIGSLPDYLVATNEFPGSKRADEPLNYKVFVRSADVWNDQPDILDFGYGKSLVHYIEQWHKPLNVDVWNCGAEITEDNFLKINLPFASVNSLITLQISSELVDTMVWKPQVSNVKFVSCNWEMGGTNADIQDRLNAVLKVKQYSSVKSTATIKPVLEKTGPVSLNPLAHTVDLAPNQEQTVKFEFLNLGTTEDLQNKVTFIIENTLGDETDRASLTFTLKKKGVAETILTVHAVDAKTEMGVSGIPVTVTYDSSTEMGFTIGGTVVFDLEGVEGKVTVKSSETTVYQSDSTTTTVKAGEPNIVTLRLYKHGVTPPPTQEWPLWLILSLAAIVIVVTVFAFGRKKRR